MTLGGHVGWTELTVIGLYKMVVGTSPVKTSAAH
jgi:hypothetical protein